MNRSDIVKKRRNRINQRNARIKLITHQGEYTAFGLFILPARNDKLEQEILPAREGRREFHHINLDISGSML
jgi:hypothetical protein